MKYYIQRTDKFNEQLEEIILYLAKAFSKEKAYEYLSYLEETLESLSSFPELGVIPRFKSIAIQEYRSLICEQNIIFYKINETAKAITLHIIVPAKRDYINLI